MDVVALAQFGVGYAVATLGTATTPEHVTKLLRLTDELVFSFDGDNAGRKAAWRALEVSLPLATDAKPIRFLFLPAEHDPDSYIRAHGKEAFEQLVRGAPTLSEFLISQLRSEHDLGRAEGRAGFVRASKQYVERLTSPATALRIQLMRELAELGKCSVDELEQAWGEGKTKARDSTYSRPAPARQPARLKNSLEWELLANIATFPALGNEIDLPEINTDIEEGKALRELVDWCHEMGGEEQSLDAMLIERFQGEPYAGVLFDAQSAFLQVKLSLEEARGQAVHGVRKLGLARMKLEVEDLRQRLEKGALSRDDHLRYGQMLLQVKQLEQNLSPSAPLAS
jgi:DNA primase